MEALRPYITRTPLTCKLLSKPPFRYLHDLISELIANSGFGEGLYGGVELDSGAVKEKESKIAWLSKIIQLTELANPNADKKIAAKPNKIVAGLEPEVTNQWLQILSHCVATKPDTSAWVKQLGGVPPSKPTPGSIDDGGKQAESVETTKSNGDLTSTAKPEKTSLSGKKSTTTSQSNLISSSKTNLASESTTKKSSKPGDKASKVPEKTKSSSRVAPSASTRKPSNATASKAGTKEKPSSKPKRSGETTSSQNDLASSGNFSLPENISNQLEEPPIVTMEASPTLINNDPVIPPTSEEGLTKERKPEPTGNSDIAQPVPSATASNVASTKPVDDGHVQDESPSLTMGAHEEGEGTDVSSGLVRPQPVQRRERPTTARKAPPRAGSAALRAGTPAAGPGRSNPLDGALGAGTPVKVMLETQPKEEDTDALYIMHAEPEASLELPSKEGPKGGLVRKLLEATGTNAAEKLVAPSNRSLEALRTAIQAATRAAHPLGRTLDYVSEDLDAMNKELVQWHTERARYADLLAKEQTVTQERLQPLLNEMIKLDAAFVLESERLLEAKARVLVNEDTIDRLVDALVHPAV
jgi:TRAF3-interacting protein 1